MRRDNNTSTLDLVIIGGGIAGAGLLRDAALRGLDAVLLEKKTFGWATSSRSSRLIHGGIRYLENAWTKARAGRWGEALRELGFVRVALRECRTLERIAPDLIKPLQLVIPLYHGGPRRPSTVRAGAYVYALLALLSGDFKWPRTVSGAEAMRRLLPGLRTERLSGGVVIWDRTTDDKALVEAVIASALSHGGRAHERTEVTSVRRGADGLFTVTAVMSGSGPDGDNDGRPGEQTLTLHARAVVDATGPWANRTAALSGEGTAVPLIDTVAGAHIEIPSFAGRSAILEARDGRVFFMIDRGDRARVGTTERPAAEPDTVSATQEEIEYLMGALRHYFPDRAWSAADILSSDAGIRPLARSASGDGFGRILRDHRIVTTEDGVTHLVGVKLTDHRRAAEETLDHLIRRGAFKGRPIGPCLTARLALAAHGRS